MKLESLISAKGLQIAAGSVVLGFLVLIAWFILFFAGSGREHWITWALYFAIRALWFVLIFGGLAAILIIGIMLLIRHVGGS